MKFSSLLKFKSEEEKVLLLIEPGGIGDYVLIRPYLKFIKQSPKYKDYKVIYLAKDSYIDFVRAYDSDCFDSIISYDPLEFDEDRDYRKYLLKKLNSLNVDTIINLRAIVVPNLPDWCVRRKLIKHIKANNKIADVIKLKSNKRKEHKLKFYTDIIYNNNEYFFELERRRLFFEKFLGINIPKQNSSFENILGGIDKNTVLISMGSLSEYREYPVDKCIILINKLLSVTDYKFALLGIQSQSKNNQTILKGVNDSDRVINLAGKTNINQLPDILKRCALFIGTESGTVHIANSVGCKTICLSNGSFYQRFHPYPDCSNAMYIYPQWFKDAVSEGVLNLMDVYGGEQPWSLNGINVEEIVDAVAGIRDKSKEWKDRGISEIF